MMVAKKIEYVDDEKFGNELRKHREARLIAEKDGLSEPPLPNYIADCFMKIATNYARIPQFSRYSFLEDMIMDAVENSLLYYRNFDPDRISKVTGKPVSAFSYFTQVSFRAFIRRIGKEHKNMYARYKYAEEQGLLWEAAGHDDGNGHNKQWETYSNISEFIEKFERKEAEKKAKKLAAK